MIYHSTWIKRADCAHIFRNWSIEFSAFFFLFYINFSINSMLQSFIIITYFKFRVDFFSEGNEWVLTLSSFWKARTDAANALYSWLEWRPWTPWWEWKTSIKWFFYVSPLHFDPAVIDIPKALIDDYLSKMIQDWLMAGKHNAVVGLPPQLLLYSPSWPSYLPLERHALRVKTCGKPCKAN